MNTLMTKQTERGLTLMEVFIIIAVLAVLAAWASVAIPRANARARGIYCNNNMKQIGLGFRVWEGDHGDKYPMAVPGTNGGTMEFTNGLNAWRHFQVTSNELSTPLVLICPSDYRLAATNFDTLRNSNLSYFVGVEADETNPQLILSGDRNVTNGTPVRNGVLLVTTNEPAGWAAELHKIVGNVGLADGSVEIVSSLGLRNAVANTSLVTNRLQMPTLGP